MELTSLHDLYVEELKDLYNAENQILKALPKMVKAASSQELKNAFEEHLQQTEGHVQRLEQIFQGLDQNPSGKKCKAMHGIIEEGKQAISEKATPEVKDASLIAAAQRVEHYEMSVYGTVRTFARTLGDSTAENLLQETLNEEEEADRKLTDLAENSINSQAAGTSVSMNRPRPA